MTTKKQVVDQWFKSQCPYCGVGCGVTVGTKNNRVVKVKGDATHPSTKGLICKKPIFLPESLKSQDRLHFPQIRVHQDLSMFIRASWDETMNHIATKFKQVLRDYGPDAIAFYGSGQFSTEDYYVANKFAKGFLGTNNFDANSRLCMGSAVVGYASTLGSDGPPPSYEDIELADCFFLIGTNTAACHPVLFNRIKKQKKANPNTKIIVVDPRRTKTADAADLHLSVNPGSDVALLNGMFHVLLEEKLIDETFISEHTERFEEAMENAREWTPEKAADVCGIEADDIRQAARMFGQSAGTLSFWSMGVNQSTVGVAKNHGIINLHLATGKIGTPGNGPFSLTGQPNAMGGREVGGLSHLLPGYRLVANETHRQETADLWGVPVENINTKPGKAAIEMFKAAAAGKIKILWIACTNPVVSMPDTDTVEAALRRAELVIVQDAYHPTDTTKFAHVLLPAAQFSEREGVMTNSERRLTHLPKMVDPPGEALPDWEIFARFGREMGFVEAFSYESAADVFAEFVQFTKGRVCDYSAVTHERLIAEGPLQWPVIERTNHGKTDTGLYTDLQFPTPSGRAKFFPPKHALPHEVTDEMYPLILTTGRLANQWHTMTRTGKSANLLKGEPSPFVEIHPADAEKYKIERNKMVHIVSRRGVAVVPARITDAIRQGTVFMPFHWGRLQGYNLSANNLTNDAVDPISQEPELKACAVRVTPVWLSDFEERATEAMKGMKGAAEIENKKKPEFIPGD